MNTTTVKHCEIDHPVVRLASLWQHRMTTLTGAFHRNLTIKEMGQLKFLRKRFGVWTFFVVDWALENWSRFCQQARLSKGLDSVPPKPHIGFLLAHGDTAVNLMSSIAKTMKPVSEWEIWFKEKVHDMVKDLLQKQKEALQKWEEES